MHKVNSPARMQDLVFKTGTDGVSHAWLRKNQVELPETDDGPAGFEADEAMEAIGPLARANLENILNNGPALALSGPVERNDVQTIKKHLNLLTDEKENNIYKNLSLVLTNLAKEKHPEKDYLGVSQILGEKHIDKD